MDLRLEHFQIFFHPIEIQLLKPRFVCHVI